MTREQQRISKQNHKLAVDYFRWNGEWFPGCVLHHINMDWKANDVERYIQWFPRDLQVLTKSEHSRIHALYKQFTQDTKDKLSKIMMGNTNSVGHNVSEEARENISKNNPAHKKVGWHWYNNGVIAKQLPECPEGWVKGKKV